MKTKILFIFCFIVIVFSCQSQTDELVSKSKKYLEQEIASESKATMKLTSFKKTNGYEAEQSGIKFHIIEWEVIISIEKSMWKLGNSGDGFWRSFSATSEKPNYYDPKGFYIPEGPEKEYPYGTGTTVKLTGQCTLHKTDNGWIVKNSKNETFQILKQGTIDPSVGPYAIGKNIQEGMKLPPNAKTDSIQMVFIYEKDGKKIEIPSEQIKTIDSTYKYIGRIDKVIREGDKAAIYDFSITSTNGSDYTKRILNYDGYYFFLVCNNLNKTNKNIFGKVNDFSKFCSTDKVPIICLTATVDPIASFKKETGTEIDFYLTDNTQLETMTNSNPGLILLKKGTVIAVWNYSSFPSYADVKNKYIK